MTSVTPLKLGTPPLPTSFAPLCVHTPLLRLNNQIAPTAKLPPGPSNLSCWAQLPPLRVKIHAAPAPPLSFCPPIIAVLPSAESATEIPCRAGPIAPLPTSLPPCCVHMLPERVKIQAAPLAP